MEHPSFPQDDPSLSQSEDRASQQAEPSVIPWASSVSMPRPPSLKKGKAGRPGRAVGIIVTILIGFSFLLMVSVFTVGINPGIGPLSRNGVVLIDIQGPIMESKNVIDQIDRYKKNDSVQAFVFRINSPGGGVVAAQDIHQEMRTLRDEYGKKVVVSFGNMGASGAYYIACGADRIVAGAGTMTGSIGVVMQMPVAQELLDRLGLRWEVVKGGDFKDTGSMFREMREEERKLLQAMVNDVHAQFMEAVAEGRGLDMDFVQQVANGQVLTGRQAQELGLVDRLGNLNTAIDEAKEISGILGEVRLIHARKPRPALFEELFRTMAHQVGLGRIESPVQYRIPWGS